MLVLFVLAELVILIMLVGVVLLVTGNPVNYDGTDGNCGSLGVSSGLVVVYVCVGHSSTACNTHSCGNVGNCGDTASCVSQ